MGVRDALNTFVFNTKLLVSINASWIRNEMPSCCGRPGRSLLASVFLALALAFGRDFSENWALALPTLGPGQSYLEPKTEKAKAEPISHGFLASGQGQRNTNACSML